MNILQTLHPPDKDYGHMKIEEPKTPYSYYAEGDDIEANSDNEASKEIDPDKLADLLNKKSKNAFSFDEDPMEKGEDFDGDEEDLGDLTEEEKERRNDFESKRKKHYNEYQMVKLARKLMNDENDEAVEDDENNGASSSANNRPKNVDNTTQNSQVDDISNA